MQASRGNKALRPVMFASNIVIASKVLDVTDEKELAAMSIFGRGAKLNEEMEQQRLEIAEILKKAGHADLSKMFRPQTQENPEEFEKDFEVSSLDSQNSDGVPLSEYLQDFSDRESQKSLEFVELVDEEDEEDNNFFNLIEASEEEPYRASPNFGANNRQNLFGAARQNHDSIRLSVKNISV